MGEEEVTTTTNQDEPDDEVHEEVVGAEEVVAEETVQEETVEGNFRPYAFLAGWKTLKIIRLNNTAECYLRSKFRIS